MVKLRRLTRDLITHFPDPSGEPVLQTKGLLKVKLVLRRFRATKFYQILPFSTKNVQRTGSNRAPNRGFSRAIYLNRVKSGRPCQSVTGASPCWFELNTEAPRHRGRVRRSHERSFVSGRFPIFLCASVSPCWKRLRNTSQPSQGFRRARARAFEANILILKLLLAKSLNRRRSGMMNLKDLLSTFPVSVGPTFSGFIGLMKRRKSNSLILNLLFADWLRQTGQGLLNLKDLLTVSPPSPKKL